VKKEAAVGDLVLIIDDTFTKDPHNLPKGTIDKVQEILIPTETDRFIGTLIFNLTEEEAKNLPNRLMFENHRVNGVQEDVLVLVEADEMEEEEGESAPYRTFKVGDKVRIVKESSHFFPVGEEGEIVEVMTRFDYAGNPLYKVAAEKLVVGLQQLVTFDDIELIQPSKRKLRNGCIIRMLVDCPFGGYKFGDEFVVIRDGWGDFVFVDRNGDYREVQYLDYFDYEIIK
jgi:hypothetical protein